VKIDELCQTRIADLGWSVLSDVEKGQGSSNERNRIYAQVDSAVDSTLGMSLRHAIIEELDA
jgi:hypothetical protein